MTLSEALLAEAAGCFPTGSGATEYAALETVRALLRVSEYDAKVLLSELVNMGRVERRVAGNGFVTIWRPSGKRAHEPSRRKIARRAA